ncbi:unnamed protein product [Echinostoma caproni]|uniref:MFS domain-containing protein n=1 Tax=Echinostoma caproni TaxID=27848 RepID=A0A183A932_9TREM|nr:unnamed protein product [Echinostoma caproni]
MSSAYSRSGSLLCGIKSMPLSSHEDDCFQKDYRTMICLAQSGVRRVQVGTVLGQFVAGTLSQVREIPDKETGLIHYSASDKTKYDSELLTAGLNGSTAAGGQSESRPLTRTKKLPVPWRHILASPPVWALLIAHVTYNWSWYSLITSMPTYMARVLGFDMFDNGILSSIPYVVQIIVALAVAQTSDMLIARHLLSVTWVRKLNNLVALGGVGAGLLIVSYLGCRRVASVALLATSIGLMGFATSGYSANTVDLAPKFAGNIISLTNTVATLPGIFGPMLVGYMTKDGSTIENWRVVFGVSTALAWFGALLNLILTSGEVQSWAQPTEDLTEPNKADNGARKTKR